MSQTEALAEVERVAIERTVEAGANGRSIEIVEREDIALAYLPASVIRVRVKAVGELATVGIQRWL